MKPRFSPALCLLAACLLSCEALGYTSENMIPPPPDRSEVPADPPEAAPDTAPSASYSWDADAVQKLIDDAKSEYQSRDLPDVPHRWTLTAGNYWAGEDIPSGKIDLSAVSGSGNVVGGDWLEGGINEILAADPQYAGWTSSFRGLKLLRGDILSVTSDLVVELNYSLVWYGTGTENRIESAAVELGPGNYEFSDLPHGYLPQDVTAVSGMGNFYGGEQFEGGVNATMAADPQYPGFISRFRGFLIEKGDTFSITGDLVLRFTPYYYEQ